MKVEIKNIEFETWDISSVNDNYPNSGFFMVKIKETDLADLRFINKSNSVNFCICPEVIFNDNVKIDKEKETEAPLPIVSTIQEQQNKFDGDFILEFSRILLNRK